MKQKMKEFLLSIVRLSFVYLLVFMAVSLSSTHLELCEIAFHGSLFENCLPFT